MFHRSGGGGGSVVDTVSKITLHTYELVYTGTYTKHTHNPFTMCATDTCSSFPPAAGKTDDLRTAVQLPAAPVEFSSRVPSKSN